MEYKKKSIGRKIKEIRKTAKMTQELFSEAINIEPSSLSNIENGKSFPSMCTVLKVMEKFKIAPEDFFDFEYFKDEKLIEEEIILKIKGLDYKEKQTMFKVMRSLGFC